MSAAAGAAGPCCGWSRGPAGWRCWSRSAWSWCWARSPGLGRAGRRVPAFAWEELHRTLALFCVAFLVLHVGTAILDPFVSIGWPAAVLPFTSGYRPLAIGLGRSRWTWAAPCCSPA